MPIAAAYIRAAGGYKIADSDPTEAASQGRRGDDFFPVEQICISMYLNGEQGPGELSSAANSSVLPSQVVYFGNNKAHVARVWKAYFSIPMGLRTTSAVQTALHLLSAFMRSPVPSLKWHQFSRPFSTTRPNVVRHNQASWPVLKCSIMKAVSCIIGVDFIASGQGQLSEVHWTNGWHVSNLWASNFSKNNKKWQLKSCLTELVLKCEMGFRSSPAFTLGVNEA